MFFRILLQGKLFIVKTYYRVNGIYNLDDSIPASLVLFVWVFQWHCRFGKPLVTLLITYVEYHFRVQYIWVWKHDKSSFLTRVNHCSSQLLVLHEIKNPCRVPKFLLPVIFFHHLSVFIQVKVITHKFLSYFNLSLMK